jgi:hypothetical protein
MPPRGLVVAHYQARGGVRLTGGRPQTSSYGAVMGRGSSASTGPVIPWISDEQARLARTFYDQRRATEDTHHQALRALGNRPVGILHGCLRHHSTYNEHTAWAHRTPVAA